MVASVTEPAQTDKSGRVSGDRITFANDLRGIAALAVVASHYLGAFWQRRDIILGLVNAAPLPVEQTPTPSYLRALDWSANFDPGAFGVALFFLISGFVIPFSLQKYDWRGFLLGRLLRIYPVYCVGFMISVLSITLAGWFFERPFQHTTCDLFLHLPGIRDVMGSKPIDGIIWTLEIEVRFYLVCAILAPWFRQGSLRVFLAPLLIILISLGLIAPFLAIAPGTIPRLAQAGTLAIFLGQYVVFMFIGVAFNYFHQGRMKGDQLFCIVFGLFSGFALIWFNSPSFSLFLKLWSYGAALGLFALAFAFRQQWRSFKITAFFAKLSYPIYVAHGMFGYALLRITLALGLSAWLSLSGIILVMIGMSYLIHRLIEQPTHRLGQKLARKFSAADTKSAAIEKH